MVGLPGKIGHISGAVDLRDQKDATTLPPLDRMALRRNLAAEPRAGFGAPDKLATVAIYARYSSKKQKELSIQRQLLIVTAYMRSVGYAIYKLYSDPARSGRSMQDREELQLLLKHCRAGRIKIIMVEDFDRWSRETFDAVEVCEELIALGVEFHSAGDGKALSKKEVVAAALKAESDRERRTLIMSMGRFQHASLGGAHSGPFFGFRYGEEPGFLVPDPEEAKTIGMVFEMAAAGISFRTIGQTMKARRRTGPTKDCKWTKSTVANILGQLAYTARWYYPFTLNTFNRKTGKTKKTPRHPNEMTRKQFERMRIVSDELFFAVNDKRKPRGEKKSKHPHFLTGKTTCDCPGVTDQGFTMSKRQLFCGVHGDGGACPANSHSVMLAIVERAVLGAVSDKLRSSVGEVDFAAAVDRSLREAAAARRAARAEVERAIAERRAQLRRLLVGELESGYPADIVVEEREALKTKLADLQDELAELGELPEPDGANERLRSLPATLEHLAGRAPFRAGTPAESTVSHALARLVESVLVMRHGRPPGTMRLAIRLDFPGFLREGDGPRPVGGIEEVHVDVEQPMGRHVRLRDVAARIAGTGEHRIDDARWAHVADRLPDVTSRRADSRDIGTRALVDALMLRFRTGLPMLSSAFGETPALRRALTRFVYAAGDQILIDVLREADPDFVAGLDLRPAEAARTRWKIGDEDWRRRRGAAARLRVLDGRDALTDEQWVACEPLLHPCVEVSYKGTVGLPGRLLLEAVVLALRTGLAWRKMPDRFGGEHVLTNSVRRLVRSGSWDRLVALWAERFPELLDGLDVGRLAGMLRGSPQWRGPSPKRSRYSRNGGLAPAVRRSRRRPAAGRKRDAA